MSGEDMAKIKQKTKIFWGTKVNAKFKTAKHDAKPRRLRGADIQ